MSQPALVDPRLLYEQAQNFDQYASQFNNQLNDLGRQKSQLDIAIAHIRQASVAHVALQNAWSGAWSAPSTVQAHSHIAAAADSMAQSLGSLLAKRTAIDSASTQIRSFQANVASQSQGLRQLANTMAMEGTAQCYVDSSSLQTQSFNGVAVDPSAHIATCVSQARREMNVGSTPQVGNDVIASGPELAALRQLVQQAIENVAEAEGHVVSVDPGAAGFLQTALRELAEVLPLIDRALGAMRLTLDLPQAPDIPTDI